MAVVAGVHGEEAVGHHIQAFIFDDALASSLSGTLPAAPIVALHRNIVLMPATAAIYDRLHESHPSILEAAPRLPWKYPFLISIAARLSQHGRIAYVETDYAGGHGDQGAVVWSKGVLMMFPIRGRRGPINRALAMLGVQREWGQDEFATTGLDLIRRMDRWEEVEGPAEEET